MLLSGRLRPLRTPYKRIALLRLGKAVSGIVLLSSIQACVTVPAPTNVDPMTSFCNGDLSTFSLSNTNKARLHSICTAWYPGSPVPPLQTLLDGTESNWRSSCELAWDSPESEREFLESALSITSAESKALPLCYYATLDWDGDGNRDYQVTDSGRFVENDTDLDQDGVPNVRDTDPLDPNNGAAVSCGIQPLPAHLSFTCDAGTDHACKLQKKLYREFDIVVVNRDLNTTDELIESNLQTIYDAANLVFKDGFKKHPGHRNGMCNGLYTMQTIAFEQCVVIRKKPWDKTNLSCAAEGDVETDASAMAHNGLFTIFPRGAELPPIIQLGTYVHELAHLWQFAYDVRNDEQTIPLISDNLWLVPEFEKVLEPLGWTFAKLGDADRKAQLDWYTRVLPREVELTEFDDAKITLHNFSLKVHQNAAEYEGLVLSDWAKTMGNFSSYSLGNPWEWHADLFIAYLYRSLEAHISANTGSKPISGEFISWFRSHILDSYENQFYHPNLKDDIFDQFRKDVLPINSSALDELVCRYLVNDDYIFTDLKYNSVLPFAVKSPAEHVALEIREKWAERCAKIPSSDTLAASH